MSEVTIKKITDLDYYKGDKSIPGIKFHSAAKELGVTAWGMSVQEIEAGCEGYPEHDHVKDGQEEVYVVLEGSATLRAEGGEHQIETGTLVRVAPGTKRKWVPGRNGVTLLAIGAAPGKAYEPRKP